MGALTDGEKSASCSFRLKRSTALQGFLTGSGVSRPDRTSPSATHEIRKPSLDARRLFFISAAARSGVSQLKTSDVHMSRASQK